MEGDYMMDWKPIDRFDLRELFDTSREKLKGSSNPMKDVPKITTSSLLNTQEPCHSERIVKAHNQFIFFGEAIFD